MFSMNSFFQTTMASTRTLACAVVLLCVTCSVAANALDSNKVLNRRSDRLERLAQRVGWKSIVRPSEAELNAVENEARRQPQPKIEYNMQSDGGCPPGYTGINCTSPICYNSSTIVYHDGTANMGDDVDWDVSDTCTDTYYFPLDSFVNDVYIDISASGLAAPNGRFLNPTGQEVLPTSMLPGPPNVWIAKYENLVKQNGAGTYGLTLSISRPGACLFVVQATTTLSVDGGFITDPRDDNVQTQQPVGNNGIERMPIDGIPSYFAFAVHSNNQAQSVSFYNGRILLQISPVNARFGCGAPNFAGTFTCNANNFYHVMIRGVDPYGYVWQRVYYYDCLAASPSKAVGSIGQSANLLPLSQCFNDGVLINAGTADAFCFCKPLFTGKMCQTPFTQ
uniref:EGF-like domain-containing protein n=1 Tax=Plectus sambesii TaxID=2011161 RepID=A0A914W022_9BILA